MLPLWKCVEGGWKGLMALPGCRCQCAFPAVGHECEVRAVEWHERLRLPTVGRALACRRLSKLWLLFSSAAPADADLPYKAKECQKWGRAESAWSELSCLPIYFTWACMEAIARHPHVHTHTEILKNQQFPGLRRWKLCKLSCSDLQ